MSLKKCSQRINSLSCEEIRFLLNKAPHFFWAADTSRTEIPTSANVTFRPQYSVGGREQLKQWLHFTKPQTKLLRPQTQEKWHNGHNLPVSGHCTSMGSCIQYTAAETIENQLLNGYRPPVKLVNKLCIFC